MKTNLILGAIVVGVLAVGAYLFIPTIQTQAPSNTNATSTVGAATTTPDLAKPGTTQIKIALLDTTGNGTGKSRGCDNLVMATRTIAATSSVLTAALQTLFAEPRGTQPSTTYNFIAQTKNTLKFDHATVVDGTANIYLTGSLSLGGTCDDPRAGIQIEETALQFSTVQKVVIYLNGKKDGLVVNEKGE